MSKTFSINYWQLITARVQMVSIMSGKKLAKQEIDYLQVGGYKIDACVS